MDSGTIIPERDTADLPLPADGVIVGGMEMQVEEVEQLVGLALFQLGKARHEAGIHIQRLQPRYWVRADRRVVGVDGWAVGPNTPQVQDRVVLQARGVDGVQAVDEPLHVPAQRVVQPVLAHPRRVAADGRVLLHAQQRVRRRVELEGRVGVEIPRRPRRVAGDLAVILCAALDDDMSLRLLCRMPVQCAVVLEQRFLARRREVLLAEEHHSALAHE